VGAALQAFLEPLRPAFELGERLEKLGSLHDATDKAERELAKVRTACREANERLAAIKAEIESAKGTAATVVATAQRDGNQALAQARADAERIISDARASAAEIIRAAEARAAEIEQALAGASAKLSAVRR
jgi:cell division septum initiation protein DivIVA